jgi:Cu2+-exporting ATPase
MCCIGCKAVAEFIESSGLQAFYEFRSAPDEDLDLRPEDAEWQHYDGADLIERFVSQRGQMAEASIDIGGMYCSACVWLLQKALQQETAIQSVDVNPAVRRAVIRWDLGRLKFSGLLNAIARIGFKPSPVGAGLNEDLHTEEHRQALKRLIVAAAAGMQVMMFAVALYAGDFFGIEAGMQHFLRVISLLVTLPIVLYAARPFFASAWRGLQAGTPGMDLPVSIAIAAAFAASTFATLTRNGEIYFDSVAMFVFFLSATRYLEMRARHRSDDHATALAQLLPDTALRLDNGNPVKVALDRVRVNDIISIVPGDVVPIDGKVLTGNLEIDESMLTGESSTVLRKTGDSVFAGAVTRAGNASVRVTRVGASTSLAEIGRMLERARSDRPPIALLADRIATRFVLAVLTVATITGAVWYWLEPGRSFEVVLATLVVTCPCALALATPAALAAAASRLAKSGFLLVRSRILAVLSKPAIIVFDKTGTLTAGRPVILDTRVTSPALTENDALRLAAALETASEHVLARAFAPYFDPGGDKPDNVQVVPGSGVEATLGGTTYRIGKADFVAGLSRSVISEATDDQARTQAFLGDTTAMLATFSIGDELRHDAGKAIAELQAQGYEPIIASGDRHPAVAEIAAQLGIRRWHAELTPADKLELIRQLQQQPLPVVMVGDGINDAPVLAAADASIALDSGTALARASADAVSLGRNLGSILRAIAVAGKTQKIIRQNITWAIIYNATAIPLAVAGLLQPWMAAVGMSLSSLLVVFNALRL